ncbi:MAG: helix-turn-helix transcriptional regulator [Pseudonocardiaceae bacterium]
MLADEPRIPNTVLIALRERAGLSQQDLADELTNLAASRYGKHPQITRKTIGRWERGEVAWPQSFYRQLLAEFFGCAGDELGFRKPRPVRPEHDQAEAIVAPLTFATAPTDAEPHVERDQDEWRQIRAALGRHRRDLAVLAESL